MEAALIMVGWLEFGIWLDGGGEGGFVEGWVEVLGDREWKATVSVL